MSYRGKLAEKSTAYLERTLEETKVSLEGCYRALVFIPETSILGYLGMQASIRRLTHKKEALEEELASRAEKQENSNEQC